jgi:hypothetical protein
VVNAAPRAVLNSVRNITDYIVSKKLQCASETAVCNPQEGLLRVNRFRRTMVGVPVPTYQQFWADKRSALKTEYRDILATHTDSAASMHQVFNVLCDTEELVSFTPLSVGESGEWAAIVSSAEDNNCQAL